MTTKQTPLGKVALIPRGEYMPGITYQQLDIITYEGSSYVVLETFSDRLPGDGNECVMLFAASGKQGNPLLFEDLTEEQKLELKGEKGVPGKGFVIIGYYNTLTELESTVIDPDTGDVYGIGEEYPYDIYIYDTSTQTWVNNGVMQGSPGKSAYQYYQESGGLLAENQFSNALVTIENKVDKEEGKGLSTHDYTTEEKEKLEAIAPGANYYEHPDNDQIRHVSDLEKQTGMQKLIMTIHILIFTNL
ncbi:MAG: hypothetical protein LIO97_02405 [Tannerellaceae bacterium]|nr:hypothetical protein [Tannerellaceae bacterium]